MKRGVDRVEIAVLGAGLLGSSAAAHLAAAGVDVVLVDPAGVRAAASVRDVAYLAHPYDPAQVAIFDSSLRLMRDAGVPMPRSPAGILILADGRGPVAAVRDEMAAAHPELEPRLFDPEELRSIEPGLGAGRWACLLDTGFPVNPRRATEIYVERAVRSGAVVRRGDRPSLIWDGTRCAGLAWDGGGVLADRVVVAAGASTTQVVDRGGSWAPVRPLWGVDVGVRLERQPRRVLVEAALALAQQAGGKGGRVRYGFSFSAAKGKCALGSTFLASEPVPRHWLGRLLERGRDFLPALANAEVIDVTACPRPQSVDGRPLLGHVRGADSLLVATGTGSRGISTGAQCGRLVAEAARAGSDECIPTELRADRFPLRR
jgi:glycine/D-amino acid oxidase-like deaminating enzyme